MIVFILIEFCTGNVIILYRYFMVGEKNVNN